MNLFIIQIVLDRLSVVLTRKDFNGTGTDMRLNWDKTCSYMEVELSEKILRLWDKCSF